MSTQLHTQLVLLRCTMITTTRQSYVSLCYPVSEVNCSHCALSQTQDTGTTTSLPDHSPFTSQLLSPADVSEALAGTRTQKFSHICQTHLLPNHLSSCYLGSLNFFFTFATETYQVHLDALCVSMLDGEATDESQTFKHSVVVKKRSKGH